jgi:hypothetical protein
MSTNPQTFWEKKISLETYHSAMADARKLYEQETEEIKRGEETSLRLAKQKEREACATLVRATDCLCRALGHAKGDFTSDFLGAKHWDETLDNGFGAGVLDKHDPRCPVTLAEMIEKGERK